MMSTTRYLSQEFDYISTLASVVGSMPGITSLVNELVQNAGDPPKGKSADSSTETEGRWIRFNFTETELEVDNNNPFSDCGSVDQGECAWRLEDDASPRCDLHSFRMLGGGDKRLQEGAVGAFGYGLLSIFHITDRPELITRRRHWIWDPLAAPNERISVCPGCERCRADGLPPTRFRLPWALTESPLRKSLRLPPLLRRSVKNYPYEVGDKLEVALLFSRVERADVRARGVPLKDVRRAEDEGTITVSEEDRHQQWRVFSGDFNEVAADLRRQWPNAIEEKRRSEVEVAVRVRGSIAEVGLFFAYLPTGQPSGIPIHINADFFPAPDRRSIHMDAGHMAEWNKSAIRCAASILANNIVELRDTVSADALWGIISRAQDASEDATRPIPWYWEALRPRLQTSPIVFLADGTWTEGRNAYLLQEKNPSKEFLQVLLAADVPLVDARLRPYWSSLEQHARVPVLDQAAVAARLLASGLDRERKLRSAPFGLGNDGRLEALWAGLGTLPRRSSSPPLADCAIAPTHCGTIAPPKTVYSTDLDTINLFSVLTPSLRFLNPDACKWPLAEKICPSFSVPEALQALSSTKREELSERVAALGPESLLAWFDSRRARLDEGDKTTLGSLPIFPSSSALRPLAELALAGDFDDPLGIAHLVRADLVGPHMDLLRELGVEQLTFRHFATDHIPRALEAIESPDAGRLRSVLVLLAGRLGEIREEKELSARLAELPIVECQDEQWRRPSEVYLECSEVISVLGPTAHLAAIPSASREAFEDLLRWFGVEDRPRVSDALALLEELKEPASDDHLSRVERVALFLGTEFAFGRLPDETLHRLRSLAWLPAQGGRELHRPTELFAVFQQYLFSSQAKFLGIERKTQNAIPAFLEAIGVLTEPDVGQVVRHVLKMADNKDVSLNRQCYEFLNRKAGPADLHAMLGRPCLLLTDQRFIAPGKALRSEHPFGRWRIRLEQDWLAYGSLLEGLRIKDSPDWRDAIDVLREIGEVPGHKILDKEDLAVVMACWRLLQDSLDSDGVAEQLAVLASRNVVPDPRRVMAKPSHLFIEDRVGLAARFEAFLKNSVIDRREGVWRAMRSAGVRPLTEVVACLLVEHEPTGGPGLLPSRLAGRRDLLARVAESSVRQSTPAQTATRLAEVARLRVQPSSKLKVQYQLRALGQELVSEPEESVVHMARDEQTLYHTLANGVPPWAAIAKELAFYIAPEEDPGAFASAIKDVIAADTLEGAQDLLDELGFAPLSEDPTRATVVAGRSSGVGGGTSEEEMPSRPPPNIETEAGVRDTADVSDRQTRDSGIENPEGPPPQDGQEGGPRRHVSKGRSSGRYRTYVVSDDHHASKADSPETTEANRTTEQAAVEAVVALERSRGRSPRVMPPLHEGYDIESLDPSGRVLRYIEVKGTRFDWDGWGVGLTSAEFRNASELGDRYWLYVVERAGDETEKVHEIQDPARRVDRFLFDDGWKQVASLMSTSEAVSRMLGDEAFGPPDSGYPGEAEGSGQGEELEA